MDRYFIYNDKVISLHDSWGLWKHDVVLYRDSTGVISWAVIMDFEELDGVVYFTGIDEFSQESVRYPVHETRQLEIDSLKTKRTNQ